MPDGPGPALIPSLWDDAATPSGEAARLLHRPNPLGAHKRAANLGGVNASARVTEAGPLTEAPAEALRVEGSGGDLGAVTLDGFATRRMERLRALKARCRGPGDEMAALLPHATFGLSSAPRPSTRPSMPSCRAPTWTTSSPRPSPLWRPPRASCARPSRTASAGFPSGGRGSGSGSSGSAATARGPTGWSWLTGGYGCDVYVEATGAPQAVTQGLDMIRKRGRFIEFSVFREPVTADWSIIGDTKELDIKGVHLSHYAYETAIRMIAEGRLPMEEIITHKLPLERFEEDIAMVIDGSASLKVTLRP